MCHIFDTAAMRLRLLVAIFFAFGISQIATAQQEFDDPESGLRYIIWGDNYCEVTGYIGIPTELTIPSTVTYDGVTYEVRFIQPNTFQNCNELRSVTIGDNVLGIEMYAFQDCPCLEKIVLGQNVSNIMSYAFAGDSNIRTIVSKPEFAPSVEESNAFDEIVYDLATLYIPNSDIANSTYTSSDVWARFANIVRGIDSTDTDDDNLTPIDYATIDDYSIVIYSNGKCGIKSYNGSDDLVIIPNSFDYNGTTYPVIQILTYAFESNTTMSHVIIPEGVKYISAYAFEDCSSLLSVEIPDSVKEISARAFEGCSGLTSVTLGASLKTLDSYVFNYAYGITDVYCRALKAPTMAHEYVFSTYAATLHIPDSDDAYNSYMTTDYWPMFMNIVRDQPIIEVDDSSSSTSYQTGEYDDGTYHYSLYSNGTCTIVYYNGSDSELNIPSTVNYSGATYTVTGIGTHAFSYNSCITSVVIPDAVTTIGDYAFRSCTLLETVTLGSGLKTISWGAFREDNLLTVISKAEVAPTMEDEDTFSCYTTATLHIPDTDEAYSSYISTNYWPMFLNIMRDQSVIDGDNSSSDYLNGNYIDDTYAYDLYSNGTCSISKYYGSDSELEIPATVNYSGATYTVTGILDSAFANSYTLTSVTIPDAVTTIGQYAFRDCTLLETVTLGSGLKTIGLEAFFNDNLRTIISKSEVAPEMQDVNTFSCYDTATLYIPDTDEAQNSYVTTPYWSQFANIIRSDDTSSNEPESTSAIDYIDGDWRYFIYEDGTSAVRAYDGSASSVEVPSSVTYNGKEYTVTEIRFAAFTGKSSISEIIIPDCVTKLHESSFYNCHGLTKVVIGAGVTSIGSSAFSGDYNLVSIVMKSEVAPTVADKNAFDCYYEATLYIPDTDEAEDNYRSDPIWNQFDKIVRGDGTTTRTAIGLHQINDFYFQLYDDGTCETSYYTGNASTLEIPASVEYDGTTYQVTAIGNNTFVTTSSQLVSVIIPYGVTSIGRGAFISCEMLEAVNIPESVTSIGSSAFKNCTALTSINIPEGVKSIGGSAFFGCSALETIHLPEGIKSIGESAFFDCSALAAIDIPESVIFIGSTAFYDCTALETIYIPESVKCLGDKAFSGCTALQSATVGANVGSYTFFDCTSLKTVTITDNVSTIGEVAFFDCTALETLILGSGLTEIQMSAFLGDENLKSVISKAATAPALGDYSTFMDSYETATLYIPDSDEAEQSYKTTGYWPEFTNIVRGLPNNNIATGINELTLDDTVTVYDLSGRKVYEGRDFRNAVRVAGIYVVTSGRNSRKCTIR